MIIHPTAQLALVEALRPLLAIAAAYDNNWLDDSARKFWGEDENIPNTTAAEEIELYTGRGGVRLLTLADALAARAALDEASGIEAALAPLVAIANAYDANELDDEARKFYGAHDEIPADRDPAGIELYSGRGGRELLMLSDAIAARTVLERQAQPDLLEYAEAEAAEEEIAPSEEADAPVAEEAPAATASYPVGTEDARVRIYSSDEISSEIPNRGKRWTEDDLAELSDMFKAGASMSDLVAHFGRTPAAIIGCLARIELVVSDHPYAQRFKDTEERRSAQREKAKEAA